MLSWRTVLSVISLTFLYAIFIWESRLAGPKQLSSPPTTPLFRSEVSKNDISMGSFGGAMPPFTEDHPHLFKRGIGRRDVCNDTFPGRYKQTCEPSRTLCCIIPGAKLPACHIIIGYGACCTENADCFVDVPSSCGTPDAQTCAPDICCPAQTNCIQRHNYTKGLLTRCNVDRNLVPWYSSSSSAPTSTPTTATRTVSQPIETTGTATATGTNTAPVSRESGNAGGGNNNSGDGLTAGASAGIAIGAIAVVSLLGVAGFLLWRRKRNATPKTPEFPGNNNYTDYPHGTGAYGMQQQQQQYHGPPLEMATDAQLYEAPDNRGIWVDEYGRQIGGPGMGPEAPNKVVYAQNGVGTRELPG
ncbi:hypothetical protein B0J11DRAFT_178960 [Dendryphion nanum]|uniref:Uncharacterized protein n=1 Tax=Dendryphion nanum TaxID=256645 RepID=A0A9P9EGG8_9PLEO|nr:hypothetical protein B0J11DRAFT_178960 [Dendryphion nanum]